jgi:hypothetical protein
MGLVGRLFGLGLVIAGLFIAIYWTLWTLMIVVSIEGNLIACTFLRQTLTHSL